MIYRPALMREGQGGGGGLSREEEKEGDTPPSKWIHPVVILLPAHLGLDSIISNTSYLEQLCELFTWPQCLGVVGGKPGSSLYLIGTQGCGHLLYLDPHEVQPASSSLSTYHTSTIRHMQSSGLDPSMAFGFLCSNQEEADDLLVRVAALSSRAGASPLISVSEEEPMYPSEEDEEDESGNSAIKMMRRMVVEGEEGEEEDWEVVEGKR